jgi:hypothetical protein
MQPLRWCLTFSLNSVKEKFRIRASLKRDIFLIGLILVEKDSFLTSVEGFCWVLISHDTVTGATKKIFDLFSL